MNNSNTTPDIHTLVRERYAQIAASFQPGAASSCGCGSSQSSCCSPGSESSPVKLYETPGAATLPEEVTGLSLGCGDPITLAELQPGQTVLDLGSGGGIDCFLAAGNVGPSGRVIGVDMTPEMLVKARANRERLGLDNVEFRLGEIEHLPVADASVDVIISNCVINLSPDKPQVLREAYRALKPGGRLAVSDVVTDGPLPQAVKDSLSAWAGCISGALEAEQYREALRDAGFVDIALEPVYLERELVDQALDEIGDLAVAKDEAAYQAVFSARITARKPVV